MAAKKKAVAKKKATSAKAAPSAAPAAEETMPVRLEYEQPPVVAQDNDEETLPIGGVEEAMPFAPSVVNTLRAGAYQQLVVRMHAAYFANVAFPDTLLNTQVIAKVHRMLISARDIAVYFGSDKTPRPPHTFGDCYLAEVTWSACDGMPVGSFVTTYKPHGIGEYIVADVADLRIVDKPFSRYLCAPFALCALAVDNATEFYKQRIGGAAPKTAVVLGATAHGECVAQLHKGAVHFTGHKLSLLAGQQFDVVYDCRVNADVINAASLVVPNGLYVDVIPGTHGEAYTRTYHHDKTTPITCMHPTYGGEQFDAYLDAYSKATATANVLEQYATATTPPGLVSALGQRNALVLLTFK